MTSPRDDILTQMISADDRAPTLMLYTFRKSSQAIPLNKADLTHLHPDISLRFYPLHCEEWFIHMDLFEIDLPEAYYLALRDDETQIEALFRALIVRVTDRGADAVMLKFEDHFTGPNELFTGSEEGQWNASQTYAMGSGRDQTSVELDPQKRRRASWRLELISYFWALRTSG